LHSSRNLSVIKGGTTSSIPHFINKIGLLNWFILLSEFHEFLFINLKNGTKTFNTGKSEATTSVVDVNVFYTMTPAMFSLILVNPET
jgi:hypothetical protein